MVPRLNRRNGADLNEKLLPNQPIDNHERVRRIDAAGEQPGKFSCPVLHQFWNVSRTNEIRRRLNDIGESRALRSECRADIAEQLRALCIEIAGDLTPAVGTHLTSDEQELRGFHMGYMRI